MSNNIRIEEDLLGTRETPVDAYYGVHTLRVTGNFYINNNKISDVPKFVRDMVMAKKTAVMANKELQTISKSVASATIAACDEAPNNGKCMDQFPIDVYRGGAGTSINININEVLVNIGLELMGHQKGEYQYLNPNDHVNKYQSTDDAYSVGFRTTIYSSLIKPADATSQLHEGFERKAVEFQDILKMGRTQLQDAVSMTLGQEFRAFSILLKEEAKNIQHIAKPLLETSLDATATSTGLNTPEEYPPLAVKKLAEVTGFPCVPVEDLIEVTFDCGTYVMVRGALKRLVVKISKICNDLRSLSSGPRAGLNEINPPEPQAGPLIMLAKVNPTVPEVTNQVCFRVIGNDTIVAMVAEVDQLQLNAMKPVIGQVMLEPVHILTSACYNLPEKYINGITANKEVCEGYTYDSIGIVTYLNPFISHHNGGIVGKICIEIGKSVCEVALERGLLTEAELDDTFSIQNPMHPVYKVKRYTGKSEQ